MSSMTVLHVDPPDVYHRLGLAGMRLARSARDIRARLVDEGRWAEVARYEEDYVRALQEGFDEVDRVRRQILAQAAVGAESEPGRPAVVADAGLGAVSVGGSTAERAATERAALEASLAAAREDAGIVDLSALLSAPARTHAEETLREYVEAAGARLDALVPLSDAERARAGELRALLGQLGASRLDAAGARRLAEERLAALERDLAEGGSDRAPALATYLALCHVVGEAPRQLGYAGLQAEARRLEEALVERRMREAVAAKVSAALARAGLTDAGAIVLDGAEQRLLLDEGERECALALSEDGAGSFMLTTVASSGPATGHAERRARIEGSMRRLCSTKRERLLQELEREGLVAAVREDTEVDASRARYSATFARLVAERDWGEGSRAQGRAGQEGLRMAGDA